MEIIMPNTKRFDAEIRRFRDGFRRSCRTNNLWQLWEGETVSVFRRGETYSWSIASGDDVLYSRDTYETEEEAVSALAYQLQVGRD